MLKYKQHLSESLKVSDLEQYHFWKYISGYDCMFVLESSFNWPDWLLAQTFAFSTTLLE